MNSKTTKATTDTMFREAVAKQVQTMAARPEGVTMVVEHGTATLPCREDLQASVNRLHAERGPLVSKARAVRMEKGVTSPEFAAAWFEVERMTRDLEEAEAALAKLPPATHAEKAEHLRKLLQQMSVVEGLDDCMHDAIVQTALEEIVNSVLEARDALVWAERLLHDMPDAKSKISGILTALKKNVAEVPNA